MIYIDELSI